MTSSFPAPTSTDRRRSHAVTAAAVSYLLGRQSPNGGFCFYRTNGVEEPNLFDTFHAVAALTQLGCPVPRQPVLINFLQRFALDEQTNALYYRAFTLKNLGRADLVDTGAIHRLALEPPLSQRITLSAALRRLYQGLQLKRGFGGVAADFGGLAKAVCALQDHGGYGDKPNLEDTATALSVLAVLGALDRHTAARARPFVDALQVEGFGFTLTLDSLKPGLDVIRAGIEACDLLDLPLRFGSAIERLVLACQAADGGFARVPGALPEIESTHHAIEILRHIDAASDAAATPVTGGGGRG